MASVEKMIDGCQAPIATPAEESVTRNDSCFGGCDKLYKGWGKGKGWNRFWCKVGCFKIEVHVG